MGIELDYTGAGTGRISQQSSTLSNTLTGRKSSEPPRPWPLPRRKACHTVGAVLRDVDPSDYERAYLRWLDACSALVHCLEVPVDAASDVDPNKYSGKAQELVREYADARKAFLALLNDAAPREP